MVRIHSPRPNSSKTYGNSHLKSGSKTKIPQKRVRTQLNAKRSIVIEQQRTLVHQVEISQDEIDAAALTLAVKEKLLLNEAKDREWRENTEVRPKGSTRKRQPSSDGKSIKTRLQRPTESTSGSE